MEFDSLVVDAPNAKAKSPGLRAVPTESDRAKMIDEMLSEFERFAVYEGASVSKDGSTRTYRTQDGGWRLHIYRTAGDLPIIGTGDTVLADVTLSAEQRTEIRKGGAYWLDLRGKTRSEGGSPLTEELATFLNRYGIRLPRD